MALGLLERTRKIINILSSSKTYLCMIMVILLHKGIVVLLKGYNIFIWNVNTSFRGDNYSVSPFSEELAMGFLLTNALTDF